MPPMCARASHRETGKPKDMKFAELRAHAVCSLVLGWTLGKRLHEFRNRPQAFQRLAIGGIQALHIIGKAAHPLGKREIDGNHDEKGADDQDVGEFHWLVTDSFGTPSSTVSSRSDR